MSDFQQTVDLREQMDKKRKAAAVKNSSAPLEKIYSDEDGGGAKNDFKKISRPEVKMPRLGLIKIIIFILALLIAGFTAYKLLYKTESADSKTKNWYAVTLKDNNMVYYGRIANLTANPVVIANVYYDYDRDKAIKENKPFTDTGNLRLVKQGKETYGPDSVISVYQTNISKLEPLKADSKVLKAILEYEK